MAYAAFGDVEGRVGRVAAVFAQAGRHPDQADVERMLADVSAEVAASIRARGFDPDGLDAATQAALRGLTAAGAAAQAIAAAFPGAIPDDVSRLHTTLEREYDRGLLMLASGTHPAIAVLEASGAGPSAGSLWTDEPAYPDETQAGDTNPYLAPTFRRGQTF